MTLHTYHITSMHGHAGDFTYETSEEAQRAAGKEWKLRDWKLLHVRGVPVTTTAEPVPQEYRELAGVLKGQEM